MKQLPLPFAEMPGYAAADFIEAASNEAARGWLKRPEAWPQGRLVLWGEAGCGKTHLAHIWAAERGAVVIPGAQLRAVPEMTGAMAIDDADTVPGAEILLHLLNSAAEAGVAVLMTARLPPARQTIELADLASRLRAAQAVEIRTPEDELLARLLAHLAADRQLQLSIAVQNYLLTRLPRTPAALREAVARLDRAALEQGGRISRVLAAGLLADMTEPT
jgi:chromosomal replication initiation ATPase DnaA